MTINSLYKLGFIPTQHFYTDAYSYDLGRSRYLSVGFADTPNEVMWIYEVDRKDSRKITDLVCLHNWDYDGELTEYKVERLINLLMNVVVKSASGEDYLRAFHY